ncbi:MULTISPECIES: hypothetical protein [Haloferax]|uniref:ArsR family transcriptional regulator n=1 Tax=Haloferax marinum TaxID=2666143 RepID=A0A6A8GA78_9EURY|nr:MULTISPECIES: hypothetical protein [Haloferax]KAB1198801.1 hypothetical protein Hfx1150_15225 [Haloferax sp. CBA1150]MRW97921.1 hypothetical protein [Haloferax marinum]
MIRRATVLSFDSQLTAIRHVERRQLLFALLEADPTVGEPLDVSQVRPDVDEERLKLRMYHVHLPILERMRVVEPGGSASHVRRGPNFDDIVPLLRLLDANRHELPPDMV